MDDRDAFDAIAAEPPAISAARAIAIASEYYGLEVAATPLTSERDQNFLLTTGDGRRAVLKIANAVEDATVTDFQIRALEHIAAHRDAGLAVPEILPTLAGESDFRLELDGERHVTRLVTFLAGTPLADARMDAAVCRSLGAQLALLDTALADFTHPGEEQRLLWDMKRAPELRELLEFLPDAGMSALVVAALDEFEQRALPAFGRLRWQVIHNDANPGNVLLSAAGDAVTGIIDFGDMLRSPLAIDVAVAAAYLRALEGNPLSLIVELIAGYHAILPLTRAETEMLHVLIKMRLATTVLILHWRMSLRGSDDAYLLDSAASEESALTFLARLSEIPTVNAAQIYAQVCASTANAPQPEL